MRGWSRDAYFSKTLAEVSVSTRTFDVYIIFVVQQATAGGPTTVSSIVHGWCTCKTMPKHPT